MNKKISIGMLSGSSATAVARKFNGAGCGSKAPSSSAAARLYHIRRGL